MKKSCIFIVLLAFVCIDATANVLKDVFQKGEKLVYNLEMDFDAQTKEDNAFITWELSGDWDKFDYNFSQGKLKDNKFTIHAKDYKNFANGQQGIALTIEGKSKTKEGNYTLSMIITDVSDNVSFSKDELNADFQINYLLPPQPPLWKRLLWPSIALLALILLSLLVLHFAAKFPDGLLQLGNDEVELKGRKKISIRKELEDRGRNVSEGMDVVLVKKRFVSYQGPTIKEIKGCELHRADGTLLAVGDMIYPDETIYGLKDSLGDDIIIRQC